MFLFVIRFLGFLKVIPGTGLVFDAWLRILSALFNPAVSDGIDSIEKEVSRWPGVQTCIHKYGGIQFNYGSHELGHIHGNGLLDMLLSRKIKQQLMAQDSRVLHHHSFKNTGWVSFYIKSKDDEVYAINLFKMAYDAYSLKQVVLA